METRRRAEENRLPFYSRQTGSHPTSSCKSAHIRTQRTLTLLAISHHHSPRITKEPLVFFCTLTSKRCLFSCFLFRIFAKLR